MFHWCHEDNVVWRWDMGAKITNICCPTNPSIATAISTLRFLVQQRTTKMTFCERKYTRSNRRMWQGYYMRRLLWTGYHVCVLLSTPISLHANWCLSDPIVCYISVSTVISWRVQDNASNNCAVAKYSSMMLLSQAPSQVGLMNANMPA